MAPGYELTPLEEVQATIANALREKFARCVVIKGSVDGGDLSVAVGSHVARMTDRGEWSLCIEDGDSVGTKIISDYTPEDVASMFVDRMVDEAMDTAFARQPA